MNQNLSHKSVLLDEVLNFVPEKSNGRILDVTAGGGGHFFEILTMRPKWVGVCMDRDPDALKRLEIRSEQKKIEADRWSFVGKPFSNISNVEGSFDYILADLGISSFQIDDPSRGMSFKSNSAPDFRMNPEQGESFEEWLRAQDINSLEFIFEEFAEEPKARLLAQAFKTKLTAVDLVSANSLAEFVKRELRYGPSSKKHPAARIFQSLRMAINDELGQLKALLSAAPYKLNIGGRLAIISFHSVEDRVVKNTFKSLAESKDFDILTKRPVVPGTGEVEINPRARSAKFRVIEKRT